MKRFKLVALSAFVLLTLLAFWQIYAQDTSDKEEAQRQVIITIAEEVTNGNFDILNQYIAEDYINHTPLGDIDRSGVEEFFVALSSALTDFTMQREQILVEGNFVATRFTFSGIFENEFVSAMGVLPPTGEPFALEVINILEFDDDGMIIEEWVQYDVLSFMTQLGAMGSPEE